MFTAVHHHLEGLAGQRFRALAGQLRRLQQQEASSDRLDALCRDEVRWSESAPGLNGCREHYTACAYLLTDLAKLRWRIVEDGFGIELATPDARSVSVHETLAYKDAVRLELSSRIRQQFESPPVRDFIGRMERPSAASKKKSVLELIADGRELRTRLLGASEVRGADRVALCADAVQPYLQLVEPGGKDAFTGHSLSDIWRYFRFTWSIPATNVPGRNLFYLVRDGAHPSHAVMGITALSNAPLALGDRDRALGWTASATQANVRNLVTLPDDAAREALASLFVDLEANVQLGLDSISHDKLLRPEEADHPTEEIVARLKRRAAGFAGQRQSLLSTSESPLCVQELEDVEYGMPEVSDDVLSLEEKVFGDAKMDAARRALTAKKRAAELARLLQARLVFQKQRDKLLSPGAAAAAYATEAVTTAVNTAWFSAKNARAGTSMLEITVCGAVRPYGHILGGKLAALLMLSPEVADDYTKRYGLSVSIISSMMKNERVVKDSRLVFLGTTSLYLHGASQYNRVRLPAGIISPEQQEIRYEAMGETGGFGTVQFSADTVKAVEQVVTAIKGYREVNSVFGEGRSPKLRKLRTGLDELGFDADVLLQHHQRRIVYGVKLFPGADEFLRFDRGKVPDFVRSPAEFRDATARISAYWRERWLCQRLDHQPLVEALNSCHAWKLSQKLPTQEESPSKSAAQEIPLSTPLAISTETIGDTKLWESLAAAGTQSCSDCLNDEDLDRLHVPTGIEDFLVQKVQEGFSIILTGNAGDGKTHLLKRIAPSLSAAGALVDLDATAVMRRGTVAPILDRWKAALDAQKPYCVAANEYPLHLLTRAARGVLPDALHGELSRQTKERLAYGADTKPAEKASENLLVVDLSLRNPLAASFSIAALRRMLLDDAIINRAASGGDADFTWNFNQLGNPRVQERLGALFQSLADRGHRCTVRELWICIARMLFGDPSEASDSTASIGAPRSWYSSRLWNLPSSGFRFRLGALLLEIADPAASSHPRWDERLERTAEMASEEWLDGVPAIQVAHSDPKVSKARFNALKRRFYFEHQHGEKAFELHASGGNFSRVLHEATNADGIFKGRILQAINHAYCPRAFSGSDHDLYLWFSHRYHEQPTRAFVAARSLPLTTFQVLLPRLPLRLASAFDYRPDHFALSCAAHDRRDVSLRIDAELHTTLEKLLHGFPRHLLPDSALNKLDDFMSRLLRLSSGEDSRQFLIYSAESRFATRVTLDDRFARYEEVVKL